MALACPLFEIADPYITTGLCLLLKKDSSVQRIADLDKKGVKVAVKSQNDGVEIVGAKIFFAPTVLLT
jgi:hypothetical protein